MKTRILALLSALFLMMTALCAAEAPAVAPPAFEWDRNSTEHWRIQPDGTKADAGAHELVEQTCLVCGCEIWRFEGGAADVSDYDGQGNLIRYSAYDADGSMILDLLYSNEYDSQGHLLTTWEFDGDALSSETVYTVGEKGERIPVMQRFYEEGILSALNEYDAAGNAIHTATYGADRSVTFEEFSEYAELPDGSWYECRRASFPTGDEGEMYGIAAREFVFAEDGTTLQETEIYADGMKLTTDYNPNADPVRITTYAAEGEALTVQTYDYEYGEDLGWNRTRAYIDGVLVIETEFGRDAEGVPYPMKETVYSEDGTSVTFTFGEDGSLLTEMESE